MRLSVRQNERDGRRDSNPAPRAAPARVQSRATRQSRWLTKSSNRWQSSRQKFAARSFFASDDTSSLDRNVAPGASESTSRMNASASGMRPSSSARRPSKFATSRAPCPCRSAAGCARYAATQRSFGCPIRIRHRELHEQLRSPLELRGRRRLHGSRNVLDETESPPQPFGP